MPTLRVRGAALAVQLLLVALGCLAFPAAASAHGPVDPVASSYLARVTEVPQGVQATVVDGDLRMWMRVSGVTAVVVDPVGAPYLRFAASGVAVNENSEMWYLNQIPVPAVPPPGLTRTTPPHWVKVSGGNGYEWHEGRLHALATVLRMPGSSYVGRWTIPVLVDGHPSAIVGGLWYAPAPSPVWFWPAIVLFACALAAWRVRSERLDAVATRAAGALAIVGTALAAVGRGFHGRPGLDAFSIVEAAVVLAIAGWATLLVVRWRRTYFGLFIVAAVAVWEGIVLIPTLTHGYVLLGVPPVLGRLAAVLCLGGSASLMLLTFSAITRGGPGDPGDEPLEDEDEDADFLAERV